MHWRLSLFRWWRGRPRTWVAREHGSETVVGYGGCSLLHGEVWNLGYRLAVTAQGRGFATELAQRAMERAHERSPGVPVVAYLLEHNHASEAVAQNLGMTLMHRGADRGNPDAHAIRLVYADR